MDTLRAEVGRRDKMRLSHDSAAVGKRQAMAGPEVPHDVD
jgi:hypothetical protein